MLVLYRKKIIHTPVSIENTYSVEMLQPLRGTLILLCNTRIHYTLLIFLRFNVPFDKKDVGNKQEKIWFSLTKP